MLYVDTRVVVALLTVEPSTEAVTAWFSELEETGDNDAANFIHQLS